MLARSKMNPINVKITDTGLHRPVYKQLSQ